MQRHQTVTGSLVGRRLDSAPTWPILPRESTDRVAMLRGGSSSIGGRSYRSPKRRGAQRVHFHVQVKEKHRWYFPSTFINKKMPNDEPVYNVGPPNPRFGGVKVSVYFVEMIVLWPSKDWKSLARETHTTRGPCRPCCCRQVSLPRCKLLHTTLSLLRLQPSSWRLSKLKVDLIQYVNN